MYKSIYLPLDNSAHSLRGVDLAIALAKQAGARLTGSHVYAAKLHDRRFRQMEGGLPEAYRKEDKLVEQRDIHDDLITRGLQVISDSYLDVFRSKCAAAGLAGRAVSLEGKNWQALVKDIAASDADLVVMGALGLGAVEASQLGSVCERVARRIDRDLLVIRNVEDGEGAIVVALDGSPQSYGALLTAIELARVFARPVEAVAAFDPDFHYVAFNSIAKVLSPEAASVFRFQEQERLHEEIIDSGLAKIYQGHLDVAKRIAADEGVELTTRLLSGKPFEQLLRYARETQPWLMLLGRIGVHSQPDNPPPGPRPEGGGDHGSSASPAIHGGVSETKPRPGAAGPAQTRGEEAPPLQGGVTHGGSPLRGSEPLVAPAWGGPAPGLDMDLGSATENLLRQAPCNLLLSARCFIPPIDHIAETTMSWTEEAEARMAKVPEFVRGMARQAVLRQAAEAGHTVVTSDVIDACLAKFMPGGAAAMKSGGGKCPFAHGGAKTPSMQEAAPSWEPAALAKLEAIGVPAVREHARLRIEKMAKRAGKATVDAALVEEALRAVTEMLG